jgi:hypothetical protein
MHHRLVILIGAAALAGVGVLVACSDDSMSPLPGGGTTSSSSSGQSSGQNTSGGPVGDDDDGGPVIQGDGGDSGCGQAPYLHHTDAGFFCQFLKSNTDAGGASSCNNDEVCCNSNKADGKNFPVSFCAHSDNKNDQGNDTCNTQATAYGSVWADDGGASFECASASNCGTNQVCCAKSADGADAGNYVNVGKFSGSKAPPAACNAQFMYKLVGTKCADQCATDKSEIELCSKNDGCSNGKACKPAGSGVSSTLDVGYCPF